MMKFSPILVICAMLCCASAFTIIHRAPSVPPTPPVTVPYVDIQRYLGAWYEQAVIPYFWERNCTKTVATYSLNKNGSVRVEYNLSLTQQQM
jgi:apolipoprotein D and lipocalin family protein